MMLEAAGLSEACSFEAAGLFVPFRLGGPSYFLMRLSTALFESISDTPHVTCKPI
jgi:hypothetical protein